MILYHGSNEIIMKPEIIQGVFTKDFGWGFYLTESRRQAEKWAYRRTQKGGKPFVNLYDYQPNPELSYIHFDETTDEWLDFVTQCRAGKPHVYDIVEGPMADDTIWNYLESYLSGEIPREVFMSFAKFAHPTHQLSLHTKAALSTISFAGAEEVHYG